MKQPEPSRPTEGANRRSVQPAGYAACKRCGQPFQPKPTKLRMVKMTTCCETCQCKNLFDGLDMPTPPSLLDRHTKHPTLTDAEWRRELAKPDDTEAA